MIVVTNSELYEIEMDDVGEGYKWSLKSYKISKVVGAGGEAKDSKGVLVGNVQE